MRTRQEIRESAIRILEEAEARRAKAAEAEAKFYEPGERDIEASHRVWLSQRIAGLPWGNADEGRLVWQRDGGPIGVLGPAWALLDTGFASQGCLVYRPALEHYLLGDSLSSSGPEPER